MNTPLIDRTENFANAVRMMAKNIPYHYRYDSDIKQLLRASGSVAANYIEAQEASSRRDFLYRIRICRKEARECCLWLSLLRKALPDNHQLICDELHREAHELLLILSTIARRVEQSLPKKAPNVRP